MSGGGVFKKDLRSQNRVRGKETQELEYVDTGLVKFSPQTGSGGGAVTEERLRAIWDDLIQYYELWLAYPDKLVDLLLPIESSFQLLPFQIVSLRVNFRYKRVSQTATRGYSKSFMAFLTKILKNILIPGNKETIVAEKKGQATKIAGEKVGELTQLMPLLDNEIDRSHGSGTVGSGGNSDYMRIKFKNGSELDISGLTNATRGGRRHGKKYLPFHDFTVLQTGLLTAC